MCTKIYTETQRFGLKDWFLQREIKRCKYITCPGLAQLVISICNKINPTIHLHGEHNHIYIISVLIHSMHGLDYGYVVIYLCRQT